ncbi:MAG: RnfABCDGE type electron transport complex subunit D [Candidatus Fimenecus sp.]
MENEVDFLPREVQIPADGRVFTPEMQAEIKTTQKYMLNRLLMLAAPVIMAWYYYGGRAMLLIVLSALTAMLCEYIGMRLVGTVPALRDLSAAVIGITVALLLPASSPIWLVLLATSFAVLVVKVPFGTARTLLFSPAAAGVAFVTISLPEYVFSYPVLPESGASVAVYGSEGFAAGVSLTQMLKSSTAMGATAADYINVLIGNAAGPMGTGCGIALLGVLLFLAVRSKKGFTAAISCLLGAALYAFLFPRITTGRLQSVFMELSGGMLFFAALFLLPEEAILPKRFWGCVAYGVSAGLFTMLFRRYGTFEEGAVFAILLSNALVSVYEKLPQARFERRRRQEERRKLHEGTADGQVSSEQGGGADV